MRGVFCIVVMCTTLLSAMLLPCALPSAFAADISVSVDPSEGTIDDTFIYQVLVRGTEISGYNRPVLRGSSDFDIDFSSTKISHILVNGSLVNSLVFMYRVVPKSDLKPGRYSLPGGYFERGMRKEEFDGPSLNINAGGSGKKPISLGVDFAQTVDNTEPYIGQQITYRAEIAAKNNLAQATLSEVEFDGFYRESYGKKREEMRNVGPDTRVYSVREALFPTSVGPIAIPKRSMTAVINVLSESGRRGRTWDPFFGSLPDIFDFPGDFNQVEKKFSAAGVALNVKPLPPAPPGAQPYIPVGTVTVASSTDKKLIKQGEGCSYQVEFYGDANLRPLELTANDDKTLRIFPDKPDIQTFIEDGRIKFRKRFSFAIIPLISGKVELPTFSIVVFDPGAKEFRTVQTPTRSVSVIPSEGTTPPASSILPAPTPGTTAAGPAEGMDLSAQLTVATAQSAVSMRSTIGILALLPIFYLLISRYGARLHQLLSDPVLLARRNALPRALQRLDALRNLESANQTESILGIMRNFIGDKAGRRGDSLTATDARELLEGLRVEQSLRDESYSVMSDLEGLVYSGLPEQAQHEELKRLQTRIREILMKIDQGMSQ